MDDSVSIPHPVVELMVTEDFSSAKAWRLHLGIPVVRMAEHMGITTDAYAMLESATTLDEPLRTKVVNALGISPDQLL